MILTHDPERRVTLETEEKKIAAALGENVKGIHHIGSTAILNVYAKPVRDFTKLDEQSPTMRSLGYEVMGEFGIPGRRYFRKDNPERIRTHQIHTFEAGSVQVERYLAFCDYLLSHPKDAQKYSELKRKLAEKYPQNMDGYIEGKDAFIKEIDRRAALWRKSKFQ